MTVSPSFAREEAEKVGIETRRASARAKIKLLVFGVDDDPQLFDDIEQFKEEHYAYDNGNWGVDAGRLIPSELLLPGGIVCKVHIRPGSPLRIRKAESNLVVQNAGNVISEAALLPRPTFWQHNTNSGKPTKRLAHFYGATCLNFNIYSGCQFYDVGKPCRFCSVQPTQALHRGVEVHKSKTDLADTCALAVKHDRVEWILATGGSHLNGDAEFDAHVSVLHAVQEHLPWEGRFRGNLSLMPPKNLDRLDELHELGVDHPSFNLEAWPQNAFERICPGKAEYVGFDHIMSAYDRIVDLYGSGSAWCNFVGGLVPLEDQMDGFTAMAKRGVIPGANIYHPDVKSPFGASIPSPGEDYIVRLYRHAAELYHKYGFKPFFDSAVLRNSLANEAYEDLI